MTRPYLTSHRLADLRDRLDDRDWSLIADLRRVRVLDGLQVQRLHHGDGDAAKARRVRQLGRLSRWQVIRRLERRVGGVHAGSASGVYALDIAGQRLAQVADDQRRRPWTPSSPFLRHALTVSEVFVQLVARQRSGRIELDRFDTEPDCWQPYNDHGGRRQVLKPDALVVAAVGEFEHWSFLEVDLATETTSRVRAKMRAYIEYTSMRAPMDSFGVVPAVVWATPSEDRAEQLRAVARTVRDDRVAVTVCTAGQATDVCCGGAL